MRHMRQQVKRTIVGFTLIELLVAIAIFAIAAALGVPAFNDVVANNRMTTQINRLVLALNLARGEAVTRKVDVVVAAAAGGWADGWTVTETGSNTVLRVDQKLAAGTLTGLSGGVAITSVTYEASGMIDGVNTYTFDLCDSEALSDRQISISATGRVNMNSSYACP